MQNFRLFLETIAKCDLYVSFNCRFQFQKIRHTLIDDFQELNESLTALVASGGKPIVQRIKKITGAQAIDSFLNISNG